MSDPWEPVDEQEAVRLANEGARRAFCPRCERGHEGPCTGPQIEARSTQVDRAPTLGEMAGVLLDWQERGVGLASLQYATGQVFWRELSAAEEVAEQVRAIRTEYRAAYLGGARDEHHPLL